MGVFTLSLGASVPPELGVILERFEVFFSWGLLVLLFGGVCFWFLWVSVVIIWVIIWWVCFQVLLLYVA